jgi:hypothetical protein
VAWQNSWSSCADYLQLQLSTDSWCAGSWLLHVVACRVCVQQNCCSIHQQVAAANPAAPSICSWLITEAPASLQDWCFLVVHVRMGAESGCLWASKVRCQSFGGPQRRDHLRLRCPYARPYGPTHKISPTSPAFWLLQGHSTRKSGGSVENSPGSSEARIPTRGQCSHKLYFLECCDSRRARP